MKKISIIYYSETGNTDLMAKAIWEGARDQGAQVSLINGEDASKEDIVNADVVALGSPAMGSEQLQVTMEYYVDSIKDVISGKPLALFGSYDWGDGLWMRRWHKQMKEYGAKMIQDENELIIHLKPDDNDIEKYKDLGNKLANY